MQAWRKLQVHGRAAVKVIGNWSIKRAGQGQDPELRKNNLDRVMPLRDHFHELRARLTRSLLYILLAGLACFFIFDYALVFISQPYLNALGPGVDSKLVVFGPTAGFTLKMKITLYMALCVALPGLLFEVWRFVRLGLTRRERHYARLILPLIVVFFAFGIAMGYRFLPSAMAFLVDFAGSGVTQIPDATSYLAFFCQFMLAMGFAFQFPLLLMFLQVINVVTWRQLLTRWRYAVAGIVLVSAVITPPDAASMLITALLLIGFYFAAIGLGYIFLERKQRSAAVHHSRHPEGGASRP